MRKYIGISCLFVAQMVCQAPSANAQNVAPPVGVLAMVGSQVPGTAESSKRVGGDSAYSVSRRDAADTFRDKVPATRRSGAALRPPHVFSITAGRTITANLKQNRPGELLLKWSRVDGAASYVVQVCKSPRCEPGREVGDKFTSRAEGFVDLATVTETKYATTSFKRGTTYRFRILALDSEGRRGVPSVVVAQRAL